MGTEIVRHGFGELERQQQGETSLAAVVAREQAMVQARFIMAERNPRRWDDIRVRLLQHCDRPGFALIARYKKPAGKKQVNGQWVDSFAEGFSARFAEVARQEVGNLETFARVTYETEEVRVLSAGVLDYQRNNSDVRDITISKRVEKRGSQDRNTKEWRPPEGRDVVGQRTNSRGEITYLVKATDDEVKQRQNSEISKATRDETMRLIPRDILDDCLERVMATLNDPKKVDPGTMRKRVIDAFAGISIMPSDLITYLGCELEKASPSQVAELRGLYTAINDGDITFNEALEQKYGGDQPKDNPRTPEQVAEEKLAAMKTKQAPATEPTSEPAVEDVPVEANAAGATDPAPKPGQRGFGFGGKK